MKYRRSGTGLVVIYSDEEMHAALEINMPNYATAILSAEEIVDAVAKSTA